MILPGIEDSLRALLDPVFLRLRGRRPRKGVVDNVLRVTIVALQPSCDCPHPRHVDVGFKNTEMVESGIRDNRQPIITNYIISQESHWNVASPLRRRIRNRDIITFGLSLG